MDKVKQALTDFTSRSGHHDTSVHENVAPAVTSETVKPHQHEEINTAVDKEVHQDHYHHTVQPVHDREVLPETHTAKLGGVQHRQFDNRDHDHTKRTLAEQQAQFKDERRVEGHTSSQSVAPTVGGEHVHHHIHETIQPVVHKETIQPNVVHTTVPIHEVHHNKATHHGASTLPAMTMGEFQSKGGALTGREERHDEFEGVPKNIGGGSAGGFGRMRDEHQHGSGHHGAQGAAATAGAAGLAGAAGSHGTHGTHNTRDTGVSGGQDMIGSAGTRSNLDHSTHASRDTSGNTARESTLGNTSGTQGRHVGTDGQIGSAGVGAGAAGVGSGSHDGTDLPRALTEDKSKAHHSSGHHDSHSSSGNKPSLMDKLNPKKDADGDGKAGMMS